MIHMAKKEEKKAAKQPFSEKKVGEKKPFGQKAAEKKAGAKVEKKPVQKNVGAAHAPKQEEKAGAKFASTQELAKSGVDTAIIFYPLITEKAVGMIEAQNKLCFVVSDNANKTSVKKAIETMYGVKIRKVNIVRDMKGRKKAIVKLDKRYKADEIAMKLGVI